MVSKSNFFYKTKDNLIQLDLSLGRYSNTQQIETEELYRNSKIIDLEKEEVSFIASKKGSEKRFFFSSRGALVKKEIYLKGEKYTYLEIKGCGKPFYGIGPEYFTEDGRDLEEFKDPIGGFLLSKARAEWNSIFNLRSAGVRTQIPLLLLRLEYLKSKDEADLGLIIKTGNSNIRLGYFGNNPEYFRSKVNNHRRVEEEILSSLGRSLKIMHKNLGLCHNSLHEENITLNGELVDFEYISKATADKIYKDLWYVIFSFGETFGTPLNLSKFLEAYKGKNHRFILEGREKEEIQKNSKRLAEIIV